LIPFAFCGVALAAGRGATRGAAGTPSRSARPSLVVFHRFPDLAHDSFAEEMTRVALVREEEGDLPGAAEWWTRSLETDPNRAETWVGYAALALRAGDLRRAEEVTRQGLTHAPGDFDLLSLRGRTFLLLGAADSAKASLQAAVAQREDDVVTLADLARAQSDLGEVDASIESFRKAVRLDPKRTDVMLDAARVLVDAANASGNEERRRAAVALLEEVLARDPSNADARTMLDEARRSAPGAESR
jgi:tetratricopeptide (TPR) repeat protein